MMKNWKTLIIRLFIPALVAGFYVWSNLPRIYTHGVNYDELIYIRRTQLFEAYRAGEVNNPIWQSWDAYDQPPVAVYLYSLALSDYARQYGGYTSLLHAANLLGSYIPCQATVTFGTTPQQYEYWQCLDGTSPLEFPSELSLAQALLFRTRLTAVLLTGATLGLIALIVLLTASPIVALAAVGYAGWLSLFGRLGVMGMIDPVLYWWYAWIVLAFMISRRVNSLKLLFPLHLAMGVGFGLILSTKFNAGSLLIAYALLQADAIVRQPRRWKRLVAAGCLAGLVTVIIFIALNPYLWNDPLAKTQAMLISRTAAFQAQRTGNPQHGLYTSSQRFYAIAAAMQGEIHRLVPVIPAQVTETVILLLIAAGMIRALTHSSARPIGIVFGVELMALLAYVPLNWDRYFLPLLPTASILAALGLFNLPRLGVWAWKYKRWLGLSTLVLLLVTHLPAFTPMESVIVSFTVLLTFQGIISSVALAYAFFHQEPPVKIPPDNSRLHTFSLLVPAKHEAAVIGQTIEAIQRLDYPKQAVEALILIPASDYETIQVAAATLERNPAPNIRIIQLDGDTTTKAYSLNLGLHFARHQIIGILDAEDEPQPQLLHRISQEFSAFPDTAAVQGAVQLVNLHSTWFSTINCIEYFLWFKSVLPFLNRYNAGLIAGNTVFIRKDIIRHLGGWDEHCLTEDADLGVRLNAAGYRISFINDSHITTFEETPKTEVDFIRQRSRWDQGFLQVIAKRDWQRFSHRKMRWLTFYTLIQPLFRHLTLFNMVILPILTYSQAGQVRVVVALISWVPSYFVIIQLCLYLYSLFLLQKTYGLSVRFSRYVATVFFFYPYQLLMYLGSLRSVVNAVKGTVKWEKTFHYNLHRPTTVSAGP